jgi:hypothetical protein
MQLLQGLKEQDRPWFEREPSGKGISAMRTIVPKPAENTHVTAGARAQPRRGPERIFLPHGGAEDRAFGFDLGRVPVNAPAEARSAGSPLASWLPQAHGTAAQAGRVFPESPLADERDANAVTLGRTVHLSSAFPRLQPAERQRVLAHEAVHVAQTLTPGPAASRTTLETEAHRLGSQVVAGHRVQPRFHADAATALADDGGPLPNDVIAVRKAKARRELLLRWKAVYEGSKDRNLVVERQKIRDRRIALDDSMRGNLAKARARLGYGRELEEYRKEEKANIAKLNRKPVTLEVTETDIRLKVRLNVRFEGANDKQAKKRFPVLRRNLEQGIGETWNQKLKGTLLPGRTLEVIPEISLVAQDAPRNYDFWLITVRPTDKGPMVYGADKLGEVERPTSATSAQLDGGVMSIPPSHVHLPSILGHETLHLFGLADRYVDIPGEGMFNLREREGKPDPLGVDEKKAEAADTEEKIMYPLPEGTILEEDLGFVLDQFGIYPTAPYSDVLAELRVVEETIRTGRDPDSMINKRTDFIDKVTKSAEDLE